MKATESLHKREKRLARQFGAEPTPKQAKRLKKLDRRIAKGDDRPNETIQQRIERLAARKADGGDSKSLKPRLKALRAKAAAGQTKFHPTPAKPSGSKGGGVPPTKGAGLAPKHATGTPAVLAKQPPPVRSAPATKALAPKAPVDAGNKITAPSRGINLLRHPDSESLLFGNRSGAAKSQNGKPRMPRPATLR